MAGLIFELIHFMHEYCGAPRLGASINKAECIDQMAINKSRKPPIFG